MGTEVQETARPRGAVWVRPVPAERRLSLQEFIEQRLGRGGITQARNWLHGTFGARSISEFWRTWNPVYGYVLYYFSYRPLRRLLPRAGAVLLTFVACGLLLHDVVGWVLGRQIRFPVMTLAFSFLGLGMITTEALRIDLARWPLPLRALVNVAYVAGCILAANWIAP